MKRTIAVVTSARAPTTATSTGRLKDLAAHPDVDLKLIVLAAASLARSSVPPSPRSSATASPSPPASSASSASDTDTGMAKTLGLATLGLADVALPDAPRPPPPHRRPLRDARPCLASPSPSAFPSLTSKAARSAKAPSTISRPQRPHQAQPHPLHLHPRRSRPCHRHGRRALARSPAPVLPSLDHPPPQHPAHPPSARTTPSTSRLAETDRRRRLPPRHPPRPTPPAEADAVFESLEHLAHAKTDAQILFCFPNADAGSQRSSCAPRPRSSASPPRRRRISSSTSPSITYWSLLRPGVCFSLATPASGIMEAASASHSARNQHRPPPVWSRARPQHPRRRPGHPPPSAAQMARRP